MIRHSIAAFAAAVSAGCTGAGGAGAASEPAPWAGAETVAFEGGLWFDGEIFELAETVCVFQGVIEHGCASEPDRVVQLNGAYVIPPFADAHTHHFDGPFGLPWQREMYLRAGVFYALTTTAPGRGVQAIRDQMSGPAEVDVASAAAGVTGPDSHPAEIYEALALGFRTFEAQTANADAIRASRREEGNAYFIVETEADVYEMWPRLMAFEPDLVKVFLRQSERYDEGFGKWGPGGGIDPALAPVIVGKARDQGLRVAFATSSVSDFRTALDAVAQIITHLPCYQDTASLPPDNMYYQQDEEDECVLGREDAERAARQSMISTLITTEWSEDSRSADYRQWEQTNIARLEAAGAPLALGSNAYGGHTIPGILAAAEAGIMPPARLLNLATAGSAQAIFPDRRVGCLQSGCEASFLVLGEDPLSDFTAITRIRLRVKDGLLLSEAAIAGNAAQPD